MEKKSVSWRENSSSKINIEKKRMKHRLPLCLTLLFSFNLVFAQKTVTKEPSSPYHTSFIKDGAVIAGGIGLNVLGYSLIQNKHDLTQAELESKSVDNIPFFDRGNAGFYSEKADNDSYIPFQ